jgi:hypothetical protein
MHLKSFLGTTLWPFPTSLAMRCLLGGHVRGILDSGTAFEVRDAQNFFGAPVLGGVYRRTVRQDSELLSGNCGYRVFLLL